MPSLKYSLLEKYRFPSILFLSLLLLSTSAWHIETVDNNSIVGYFSTFAFDSADRPAISYYDSTNGNLKYAYYDSSQWIIETIDNNESVGYYTSFAFDRADKPAISYYDKKNGDLKYAYYDGSQWKVQIVDSAGNVGRYTSLAFDYSNNPAISYYDNTNGTLKYAHYDDNGWQIDIVDNDGDVGLYTSLAFDLKNKPAISYGDNINYSLKYAYYDNNKWNVKTIDSNGYVGQHTSLGFDSENKPAISYYDVNNRDLKYAYYNGNRWNTETVDSIGDVGRYTSLAFNSSDEASISYYDSTNMTLKYATVLKPGFLSVNSSTPDAMIYVNGAKQAFQTNTTLVLEVGTYNITVVKDFYETPKHQMVTINESNSAIEFSMIPISPEADYTTNTKSGTAPLKVAFTDRSTDGPTMWNLSFGDGQWHNTTNASAVSTTHEYSNSGIYTATLTVSARGLSNSTSTTIAVNAPSPPILSTSKSGKFEQILPEQKEKVVANTASSITRVNNGAEVEFNFSKSSTPITGITFDSKNNKGLVMARVDELKDTPDGVSSPPGTCYKLISINVGNKGTISTDSADNINIHFSVSKKWAMKNEIDASTIRMTKYNDDQWNDLPTIYVDEDDESIYFTSQTSGFSIFSIVGFKTKEKTVDEETILSMSEYTQEPEPENMKSHTTIGSIIIIGIAIVYIAALIKRKRK